MKNNFTHMVFILDRSGSMQGLEKDTIGGFNSLVDKQKNIKGDAVITTVLFDDQYEILYNAKNINDMSAMTEKEYFVRGSTALLDAVGKTINHIGSKLAADAEDTRPDKVLFVIITDGMENASREFNSETVKSMIEHQKTKYNWEFMFLGANIDAVHVASTYGIEKEMAVEYSCDSQGTEMNFACVCEAVEQLRSFGAIKSTWKKNIEADLAQKKNKEGNFSNKKNCKAVSAMHIKSE